MGIHEIEDIFVAYADDTVQRVTRDYQRTW